MEQVRLETCVKSFFKIGIERNENFVSNKSVFLLLVFGFMKNVQYNNPKSSNYRVHLF